MYTVYIVDLLEVLPFIVSVQYCLSTAQYLHIQHA